MVKTGEITEAEAEVHPHRNVLTRSLGTEADVQVDEDVVGLLDGDRLLLCSDGLTGMVTEDQIKAILETEPDPQRASDRLIKAANRAGGIDNITVVVLDAIGEDDDPGRPGAGCTPLAALADRRPGGPGRCWWATFFAARTFIDRQWYVGVADDKVAVYQGIPAKPLGLSLSSVDTITEIPAADADALELYRDLPQGITADSREDALAIVERIRTDVADDAVAAEEAEERGRAVSEVAFAVDQRKRARHRARPADRGAGDLDRGLRDGGPRAQGQDPARSDRLRRRVHGGRRSRGGSPCGGWRRAPTPCCTRSRSRWRGLGIAMLYRIMVDRAAKRRSPRSRRSG